MSTVLKLEYLAFCQGEEFPEDIELVLEEDFVINRRMYTKETLHIIQGLLLLSPEITPEYLLKALRTRHGK